MYPNDLTDEQWGTIRYNFEYANGYGNRAKHSRRDLINAILYISKTGCQWRMLPKDFPPWKTVYSYFSRLARRGVWERCLKDLVKIRRRESGRADDPSLLIVDSQTTKTAGKGEQIGFDGGKKNQGKKEADSR